MKVKRNLLNHNLLKKLGSEISCGCALKRRCRSATFVINPRKPIALTAGCSNFRTSTLQRHKDCKQHEDAINEEAMRDMFSNCFLLPCLHVSLHECKTTLLGKKRQFVCRPLQIKMPPPPPQTFSQGYKLSLSDQILAQTLLL